MTYSKFKNFEDYCKQQLFKDDQGFSELPYISNNPDLMLDSIRQLPIATWHPKLSAVTTANDFFTGDMRRINFEPGLTLFATKFDVKKNILCKALFDSKKKARHYFLSFAVFEYPFQLIDNGKRTITLYSTTCTFYKPGTEVDTFFYAGTKGIFCNILFTKAWVKENIANAADAKAQSFFLDDKTGFMNWIDIVPEAPALSASIWEKIGQQQPAALQDREALCYEIKNLVRDFFPRAYEEKRLLSFLNMYNPDFALVARAEQLILCNLSEPFLGVEQIARVVNISPTKLKRIFKSVFGFSMLQYHKEKNILLAFQLLQQSTLPVKSIAEISGFASASKFSAAFRKRFEILPKDVVKGF